MTDTDDDFEVIRGSGNVFADLGVPNADMEHLRARLAAKVINTLDAQGLSVREAQRRTGIAAADFSRIRQVKLDRFTIDRLMTILDKLGQEVHVSIEVIPRDPQAHGRFQPQHV